MRQSCQIWVWSSFTIPLLGAHGYEQEADLRAALKGKWGWHHRWRCKWAARVKIKVFLRSTGQMFFTVFVLWVLKMGFTNVIAGAFNSREGQGESIQRSSGQSNIEDESIIHIRTRVTGWGPSDLSLLVIGHWVGWHSSLASIHHETQPIICFMVSSRANVGPARLISSMFTLFLSLMVTLISHLTLLPLRRPHSPHSPLSSMALNLFPNKPSSPHLSFIYSSHFLPIFLRRVI